MAIYIEKKIDTKFDFHYRTVIEKAIRTVMMEYGLPDDLDVNVLIVSAGEMQEINKQTREIDQVTDVLSFPYFEFPAAGSFDCDHPQWKSGDILGDIILCAPKIISQAEEYGHTQKRETAFLTVHSMLHLLGYDHMDADDAKIMEERQDYFMQKLGILR